VNRLRNEVSNALLIPVQDAQDYVNVAPVVHSDETSFKQGNRDGKNPDRKKGWLWTVVSASVVVFEVALSRAKTVAMRLIDEDFRGIVVSDRYRGYEWLEASQRQLCWAHIKRDLTAMSERSGCQKKSEMLCWPIRKRYLKIGIK
jgi:transposase